MSAVSDILGMLNEHRFESAIALMRQTLADATAESPQHLVEIARPIVGWRGFFANASEESASEPYFRAVYGALETLAGPDSPAAMAAAENLAGILGAMDRIDEAISLRESVYAHVQSRFPRDDTRFMNVREGLGFLYSRAGLEDKFSELYRDTGLCEHLAAAERHIRAQGARVVSCCRPWSANCHIWVYFNTRLDCRRLIDELGLDACITIHDHRGTHDGSELGLVCGVHHDAVMGPN